MSQGASVYDLLESLAVGVGVLGFVLGVRWAMRVATTRRDPYPRTFVQTSHGRSLDVPPNLTALRADQIREEQANCRGGDVEIHAIVGAIEFFVICNSCSWAGPCRTRRMEAIEDMERHRLEGAA